MPNTGSKLILATALVTGSLAFVPNANAGEGGVAGAASFIPRY